MPKNTQGGYIGFVIIAIAVAVIGVASFIFLQNKTSPTASTVTIDKTDNEVATNGLNQVADAIVAQALSTTTATTTDDKTTTSTTINTTSTKKTTPPITTETPPKIEKTETPTPVTTNKPEPEKISEPTLVVEAGEQPVPTLLLADARLVPFTIVKLTAKGGDIEVDSLVLERRGLASDRIFTEIGAQDIDTERGLNSDHQYSTHKPFTIKDGETQEITLFGNITDIDTLADYDGQEPSIALVDIKTSAKISGSLPIIGTAQKVNSTITIGSMEVTNSGFDPGINKSIYINESNITFSAVRLTAGSGEPILLKTFSWLQNGTVSDFDITNVQICVDNKGVDSCYPTTIDSRYYTADFGDNVKIDKGESVDVYIKGDLLPGAANRTVDFDIGSTYDIIGYGLTYKNYIYSWGGELDGAQPEGSFSTSENPFYNGYAHNITGGSFNIGR